MEAQDRLVRFLDERPWCQDLFILDAAERQAGLRRPALPRHHGLARRVRRAAWDGKHSIFLPWQFGGWLTYWGRLDLNRRRFVELLPTDVVGGNPDETVNVSVGGNLLFIMHCEETNCQYTGVYDLDKKRCYDLPPFARKWQRWSNAESGNNAVSIGDGYFYHIAFHSVWAWTSAAGGMK